MKNASKIKQQKRIRRHTRIRSKVQGTQDRPRLSIFKSNKYLSAQIINDDSRSTLVAGTTKGMKGKSEIEKAEILGQELAKQALAQKISKVVFDRGGYIYTGRVEALAKGAREGGLSF